MRRPATTLRALVAGLVDYAGLFPPASRTMADAVAEYDEHRASPERWMLGRFIAPASRLGELADHRRRRPDRPREPWRVSAVLGDDVPPDLQRIVDLDAATREVIVVDTVECRCASASEVVDLMARVPPGLGTFVEIGLESEPRDALRAIASSGGSAKVRTGGVRPSAIPAAADVARFVVRCAELALPFKATAGLHHPHGGEYALAYEPGAPVGRMYGFLNLFLGAALVRGGMSEDALAAMLREDEPAAFELGEERARWRDHVVDVASIVETRRTFATAFGSCSFDEPVDGLRRLGFL